MRFIYLLLAIMMVVFFTSCVPATQKPSPQDNGIPKSADRMTYSMKGVGIKLPQTDFVEMKNAAIALLATEWGMEEDVSKTRAFLDQAQAAGLKVVVDGGLTYTAWGFTDDDWDNYPRAKDRFGKSSASRTGLKPSKTIRLYMLGTSSNELGKICPVAPIFKNSDWPKSMITEEQLKQAKADILEVDNSRPIHARMYEWDCSHMPSHVKPCLITELPILSHLTYTQTTLKKASCSGQR